MSDSNPSAASASQRHSRRHSAARGPARQFDAAALAPAVATVRAAVPNHARQLPDAEPGARSSGCGKHDRRHDRGITAFALRLSRGQRGTACGPRKRVAIVTQAANKFTERDFAQAFNLIYFAYRAIEAARAADPRLPLPRQASIDRTQSSIH